MTSITPQTTVVNMDMDIEAILRAANRVKDLRKELAKAEAELHRLTNATTSYRPHEDRTKPAQGNGGLSFTDQVLKALDKGGSPIEVRDRMGLAKSGDTVRAVRKVLHRKFEQRLLKRDKTGRYHPAK